MRQFFLPPEAIRDGWAVLQNESFHHLHHVLRLQPGTEILVADGRGARYKAVLESVEKSKALARILEPLPFEAVGPRLRLAVCVSKGAAFEETLDACTQLGVAEFLPLLSERTVVRLKDSEFPSKLKRWRKIVEGAAEQCNTPFIPLIREPLKLAQASSILAQGPCLWAWEGQGGSLAEFPSIPRGGMLNLVVGPEGGFSPAEIDLGRSWGASMVSLGSSLLRAPVACARLVTLTQVLFEQGRQS